MRFRLGPKSETLDDPEWPKHSVAEKVQKNLNEDRPLLSASNCRTMILVSRNTRYLWTFASLGFLSEGASNDSAVAEHSNFDRFNWLFVRKKDI